MLMTNSQNKISKVTEKQELHSPLLGRRKAPKASRMYGASLFPQKGGFFYSQALLT